MAEKPDMLLWLSDARGIYIPRDFAQSFADRDTSVSGVDAETWATLEQGPDAESYWDTWLEVCEHAVVTDENGVKFTLWQEGDLWLVPEGMEWSDENETYQWPEAEQAEER